MKKCPWKSSSQDAFKGMIYFTDGMGDLIGELTMEHHLTACGQPTIETTDSYKLLVDQQADHARKQVDCSLHHIHHRLLESTKEFAGRWRNHTGRASDKSHSVDDFDELIEPAARIKRTSYKIVGILSIPC
jgi:hypothetical protein